MSTCVVMVTVSERLEMLNRFLISLAERPDHPTDIAIHMQGEEDRRSEIVMPEGLNLIHYRYTPERLGCHAARIILQRDLQVFGYDSYVNVDDDVLLIEQTNWNPAIAKAKEPGVGFVLTNWVRSPKMVPKAITIMSEKFIPQVFVYNGGGMAYDDGTAELIRALEPVPARWDDLWPLTAYLSGRKNYRYRGSLAVHMILSGGGMRTYMRSEPRPLLGWDWVEYRRKPNGTVGRDFIIPEDRDLKPIAKKMHQSSRKAAGWK